MTKRKRPTPHSIFQSINSLTTELIRAGLVNDQRWPQKNELGGGEVEITTQAPINSAVLKNVDYPTLYKKQLEEGAFNFLLLDNAIIQMSYWFSGSALERHRLAFLPDPDLSIYQTNPDFYFNDVLFLEIVGKQAASVPLRMDYDIRDTVKISDDHPAAHLTLGQYQHCRIPITAPVTPATFVEFIVRHFYSLPHQKPIYTRPRSDLAFPLSPHPVSNDMVHIVSPGAR